MLIDEPRVSGRHARIEIVPCDGGSKCNRDYRRVQYCSIALPVSICQPLHKCNSLYHHKWSDRACPGLLGTLTDLMSFNAGCC